jgi:hypothetical protein
MSGRLLPPGFDETQKELQDNIFENFRLAGPITLGKSTDRLFFRMCQWDPMEERFSNNLNFNFFFDVHHHHPRPCSDTPAQQGSHMRRTQSTISATRGELCRSGISGPGHTRN